jgi:hypothetical protein
MLVAVVAPALADDRPVLLYREPLDRALAQVRREADPGELQPRRLEELVQGDTPYLVGTTPLSPCTGAPRRNADVLRLISEAEELRIAMRTDESWARLAEGRSAWACLAEPADATLGARLHFLVGIALLGQGDEQGAADAFRIALRSDPALEWDPDFAPEGRPAFEAVRAEPAAPTVSIRVVPPDSPVGLRVDGRTLALQGGVGEVARGTHLIQTQDGVSLWAEFHADAWLVLPTAVDEGLLDQAREPAGRLALQGVAAGAGVQALYLPTTGGTWALSQGDWTRHRVPLARRLGGPALVAGGAVAVTGLTWMLVEGQRATAIAEEVDTGTSSAAYADIQARHDGARERWTAAAGLGVGGAVLAAAGGVMIGVTW